MFADSSAFCALLNRKDQNHQQAVRLLQQLNADRSMLVLTNFIRAEAHALILNRVGRTYADQFLAEVSNLQADRLIRVEDSDEHAAFELIARYQDKTFSVTDATSFVVMDQLAITHAFTFDDDFRQYGKTIVQ